MILLSEAAKDERGSGNYAYGEKGDQTSEEVWIREVQEGEFAYVYRYPDKDKRYKFAEDARQIALNDRIGYAQYGDPNDNYAGRYGLWYAMHGADRFCDIDVPCNVDCSAMVADILIHNGLNCSRYMRTATQREEMKKLGFTELPFARNALDIGDILWRNGHTAVCIENKEEEEKVYSRMIRSSTLTKKWSTGAGVLTRATAYISVKRSELGFKPQVIVCQQMGEVLANTQWIRGQSHAYCANFQNDATAGIAVGTATGFFNPDAAVIHIPVRFADKDYEVKIYG